MPQPGPPTVRPSDTRSAASGSGFAAGECYPSEFPNRRRDRPHRRKTAAIRTSNKNTVPACGRCRPPWRRPQAHFQSGLFVDACRAPSRGRVSRSASGNPCSGKSTRVRDRCQLHGSPARSDTSHRSSSMRTPPPLTHDPESRYRSAHRGQRVRKDHAQTKTQATILIQRSWTRQCNGFDIHDPPGGKLARRMSDSVRANRNGVRRRRFKLVCSAAVSARSSRPLPRRRPRSWPALPCSHPRRSQPVHAPALAAPRHRRVPPE